MYNSKGSLVRTTKIAIPFAGLLLSCSYFTYANNITANGAVTLSYLNANQSNVDSEAIAILDLDLDGQLSSGRWHVYLEGTSSSKAGKVTSIYGEAYADAGAAADENGNGRVQLSSAEYYHSVAGGEVVVGLLYPSGFTESADWSNDETSQFIGSSFVNIQTSAAPDYALGIGYIKPLSDNVTISTLVSQAQGLGDLDSRYSSLFDELDDYFITTELSYQQDNLSVHLAAWHSTLAQPLLTGSSTDRNQGLNISLGYQTQVGQFVVKYGTANDKVSSADEFYAVSLQQSLDIFHYGVGISKTTVSRHQQTEADDLLQTELYGSYLVNPDFNITLSIQKLSHSGFDLLDDNKIDSSPYISTVRATYQF